jgi:hypothetical protein
MTENKTSFRHLTINDREIIYHMRFVEKKTLKEIGNFISKAKSCIIA